MRRIEAGRRREHRRRLTEAFKALRRVGYVTRQNFMCCQSCAGSALGSEAELRGKAAVYYHQQDAETLGDHVYLCFGRIGDDGLGSQADTQVIGQTVMLACRFAGLDVEWNGDIETRIRTSLKAVA